MKKLLGCLIALTSGVAFADGLTGTPATGQASSLPSLLMLVVFVLIFYFLLIRPQMKRSKEQRQLVSALEKGDEVITAAGLYGKVTQVDDASVEVEIAKDVTVKMQKQAITSLIPKGSAAVETKAAK